MQQDPSSSADPSSMRWESATRYYVVIAQQDLFGGWELMRAWGGRGNRRGGGKVDPMPTQDAAITAMRREARKRLRRGYSAVSQSP